jgi:hypothetical protein
MKKHRVQKHEFTSLSVTAGVSVARNGVFSGITGAVDFACPGGVVSFDCEGQDQTQNDILDYMISHHVDHFLDNSGSLFLGTTLTDYYRWSGITPNPDKFMADAEKLQDLKIRVKGEKCNVSSPIVGLVGYLDRYKDGNDNNSTGPIRGEMFYIQIMPLYMRFINEEISVKYPELVQDLLSLKSEAAKLCARYFLSQTNEGGWIVQANRKEGWSSTRVLAGRLWIDHNQLDKNGDHVVSRFKRYRREKALIAAADQLLSAFGIKYDSERDTWSYSRHDLTPLLVPVLA